MAGFCFHDITFTDVVEDGRNNAVAGVHTGRAGSVTATGARGLCGSGGGGSRTQRHGQNQETKHAGVHVEFGVDWSSVISSRLTAMTVLIFSVH